MEDKPKIPYKIENLKVVYKLKNNKIDKKLDKELERIFTDDYGLVFDGSGYDFMNKVRDLYFYKKVGE